MKVAVGGGYPLLKSAIVKRLQADGIELTTSMRDANVAILTRGCMADAMRSTGRICDIGTDACAREFECMLDVVKELSKHAAVLVLSDGNLGRVHRVLQAGALFGLIIRVTRDTIQPGFKEEASCGVLSSASKTHGIGGEE